MKKGQQQEYCRCSSSCAACKLLKRRCSPSCAFAPYFRSDEPNKFAQVHKVFGASNVSKILTEVPREQREDAVSSLVYEAEARLRDPVYGCIGAIAALHRRMLQLQHDLDLARALLARYTTSARPAHHLLFHGYDDDDDDSCFNLDGSFSDLLMSGGLLEFQSSDSLLDTSNQIIGPVTPFSHVHLPQR